MGLLRQAWSWLGAAVIAGLVTVAAPAAQAATPAEALAALNAQRAANGIPGDVTENPAWSAACANHKAYMDANGEYATHEEDPSKPGYTPEGAWAGQNSVSGGTANAGRSADGPTGYEWAPIHLAQLLAPVLAVSGYADRCTITLPGFTRPKPAGMETYSHPGQGASIYPAMVANEAPNVPGDFVGLPHGAMTGPHLLVYGFGDGVNQVRVTDAALTGPAGPVEIRTVDNYTGLGGYVPAGGIIIPVSPLVPGAYTAQATVTGDNGASAVRTWSFQVTGLQPSDVTYEVDTTFGFVRARPALPGTLVMARVSDGVEVGRATSSSSSFPQISFPSARKTVAYRSCYVVTAALLSCREDTVAGSGSSSGSGSGGGRSDPNPTPPRKLRNPRITSYPSVRGRRVSVRVTLLRAARGTMSIKLKRGRRSIRMRRSGSRGNSRYYRATVPSSGRWTISLRFIGRSGWQTRTGSSSVRVR